MPDLALRSTIPKPTDPDIIERFSVAIAGGHPVSTAATLAGLSGRTASEWIAMGEAELEDAGQPSTYAGRYDEAGSHAPFAQAYKVALAAFCDRNLGVVGAATLGEKGWLPAMTLLERRMPRDFGRRTEVAIEQRTITVNLSAQLSPATVARVLAVVAEEHLALPEGEAMDADEA